MSREMAEATVDASLDGSFCVYTRRDDLPGEYVLCMANRGKLTHDVIKPDGNGELVINGGLHGNHPAIEGLIGRLGAPNVPGWPVRLIVPDDDQVSPL